MKKIAVLTSGGDAPGMNNAVRAVVRAGINKGYEVYGVYGGFKGLVSGDIRRLRISDTANKLNQGGTFLFSARLPEFKEESVRESAVKNLNNMGIDCLVVIGGDGSYMGAKKLTEMGINAIAIPGTIDNDIDSTDYTIGYDTALNTAMEAIDKVRDTSSSHNRCTIVELMGRDCGDLTIGAAVATGADIAITQETGFVKQMVIDEVKRLHEAGEIKVIITIAEHITDVHQLAKEIEVATGYVTRGLVLAHIQRGGSPTAFDRILASRMGVYAVELLEEGYTGRCIGIVNNELNHFDILEALDFKRKENRLFKENELLKANYGG